MRYHTAMLCTVSLALGTALVGCGLPGKQTDQRRFFMLEAIRRGETTPPETAHLVTVKRFGMSERFADRELVYRTGEVTYEPDYYNQFLAPASTMVAEQTHRWLGDAGLFAAVIGTGSDVLPTHVIEGNVTQLYGDVRDAETGTARMAVEFFVLDVAGGGEPAVAFHGQYAAQTPLAPPFSSEGLVKAYNANLAEILTSFETDLRTMFAEQSPTP